MEGEQGEWGRGGVEAVGWGGGEWGVGGGGVGGGGVEVFAAPDGTGVATHEEEVCTTG